MEKNVNPYCIIEVINHNNFKQANLFNSIIVLTLIDSNRLYTNEFIRTINQIQLTYLNKI